MAGSSCGRWGESGSAGLETPRGPIKGACNQDTTSNQECQARPGQARQGQVCQARCDRPDFARPEQARPDQARVAGQAT
eukprot:7768609-Lingulodinium_polyedra.AAC.1